MGPLGRGARHQCGLAKELQVSRGIVVRVPAGEVASGTLSVRSLSMHWEEMTHFSRRQILASLGSLGSAALLTGCGEVLQPRSAIGADPPAGEPAQPEGADVRNTRDVTPSNEPVSPPTAGWNYVKLDPTDVSARAYQLYKDGSCMYAVVGGIITALAERVGQPFQSFPLHMMRYGHSGVGGWGSLCGVVNGGCAMIGLFHGEKDPETRDTLMTEYGVWYETARLPRYQPADDALGNAPRPSVAGSLLCHVSVTHWCAASKCGPYSPERKERCRRLSADGAGKIVQLLNAQLAGEWVEGELTQDVFACADCHGREKESDAMVKMNCATCHQFKDKHP